MLCLRNRQHYSVFISHDQSHADRLMSNNVRTILSAIRNHDCKLKSHVSPRGIIAPVSMMVHMLEALHLNRKSGVSRTAGEEVLVLAVTMETVIVVTLVVPTGDRVMSEVRTLGDRLNRVLERSWLEL